MRYGDTVVTWIWDDEVVTGYDYIVPTIFLKTKLHDINNKKPNKFFKYLLKSNEKSRLF